MTLLKNLAESSGGQFCEPEEVNKVLSALKVSSRQESHVDYLSLWQHWMVITCLMALLVIEWVLRKTRNMA